MTPYARHTTSVEEERPEENVCELSLQSDSVAAHSASVPCNVDSGVTVQPDTSYVSMR